MKTICLGIIGNGNMGSEHCRLIPDGKEETQVSKKEFQAG